MPSWHCYQPRHDAGCALPPRNPRKSRIHTPKIPASQRGRVPDLVELTNQCQPPSPTARLTTARWPIYPCLVLLFPVIRTTCM